MGTELPISASAEGQSPCGKVRVPVTVTVTNDEALYRVALSDYDEYMPVILRGPPVEDWAALCRELLPLAVERSIAPHAASEAPYTGWYEVYDALVAILKERGYVELRPPEFCVSRPGYNADAEAGIDTPEAAAAARVKEVQEAYWAKELREVEAAP